MSKFGVLLQNLGWWPLGFVAWRSLVILTRTVSVKLGEEDRMVRRVHVGMRIRDSALEILERMYSHKLVEEPHGDRCFVSLVLFQQGSNCSENFPVESGQLIRRMF